MTTQAHGVAYSTETWERLGVNGSLEKTRGHRPSALRSHCENRGQDGGGKPSSVAHGLFAGCQFKEQITLMHGPTPTSLVTVCGHICVAGGVSTSLKLGPSGAWARRCYLQLRVVTTLTLEVLSRAQRLQGAAGRHSRIVRLCEHRIMVPWPFWLKKIVTLWK